MEGFYSVREMTRKLGVEAHMLRYWEKELNLDIPRDSRGRRVYGEEEARLLTLVSDYKKAGKPLRLIRTMITLPAQEEGAAQGEEAAREESAVWKGETVQEKGIAQGERTVQGEETAQEGKSEAEEIPSSEAQRLQDLLGQMVAQAVRESSEEMITEMKEGILKELDYQFRLQAEREAEFRREVTEAQEDHFQRMDVLLSNRSKGRKKKLWR